MKNHCIRRNGSNKKKKKDKRNKEGCKKKVTKDKEGGYIRTIGSTPNLTSSSSMRAAASISPNVLKTGKEGEIGEKERKGESISISFGCVLVSKLPRVGRIFFVVFASC